MRAFADDLDDATGDLIVATLILGARRRGPGLARVLSAVADSVAEEVAMRRKVEAERAKPRTTARAVTLITLGVVAVGSLNGTYLAPYRTLLGQLVLVVITLISYASPEDAQLFLPSVTNNQFQAWLSGQPGLSYSVEISTNLMQWTHWLDVLITNLTAIVTDTTHPGKRFFRDNRAGNRW